jgi:hypothetical protein
LAKIAEYEKIKEEFMSEKEDGCLQKKRKGTVYYTREVN